MLNLVIPHFSANVLARLITLLKRPVHGHTPAC